jgi:hypothetical protein
MYGTSSHSVSTPMNGMGGELVDGSGTINPAALNTAEQAGNPDHRNRHEPKVNT